MYVADGVCERNSRVNEALCSRRGQVWSQQECFAIPDVLAAILCGLPFTLDLTDQGVHRAAVEIGSPYDEGKTVLASRRCDFEHAAGVPITGLRSNQPQVPHERHSANLIELGFIGCRISGHLSINISCPLLMDIRFYGTSCIGTVSKPVLSSRTCCFPRKTQVVRRRAGPCNNRIKTPSIEAVELAD